MRACVVAFAGAIFQAYSVMMKQGKKSPKLFSRWNVWRKTWLFVNRIYFDSINLCMATDPFYIFHLEFYVYPFKVECTCNLIKRLKFHISYFQANDTQIAGETKKTMEKMQKNNTWREGDAEGDLDRCLQFLYCFRCHVIKIGI